MYLRSRWSERWEEWTGRKGEAASTWQDPNLPTCRSWRGGSGRSSPPKSSRPRRSDCRTGEKKHHAVWPVTRASMEIKSPSFREAWEKWKTPPHGRLMTFHVGKSSHQWLEKARLSWSKHFNDHKQPSWDEQLRLNGALAVKLNSFSAPWTNFLVNMTSSQATRTLLKGKCQRLLSKQLILFGKPGYKPRGSSCLSFSGWQPAPSTSATANLMHPMSNWNNQ